MSALPGTTGRRRLYLMRHGFVDYAAKEVRKAQDPSIARLTDRGREEARAAGVALSDVPLNLAMHSGLFRAQETAELVLSEHHRPLKLEADARFQELRSGAYINFTSAQQLDAIMTFQFERAGEPGATFLENGELFSDGMARIEQGLLDLLRRPNWAAGLLVAHEIVNRLILAWSVGAPMGASSAFEQDTGCINILDFDLVPDEDGVVQIERVRVKAINLTPANYVKHGMNLSSLEAIFTSAEA